uniref:Uncharacterized protein LOC114325922 n=1 Tax=Diabrotica virgifera virgifera TaxID=50390 RepID=A0A6P7F2K4_DIAVI
MRTYQRKSDKGKTALDIMQRAVSTVLNNGRSVNSVAKDFLIPQKTLHRHVVKARSNGGNVKLERVGYFNGQNIFSEEQETLLANYLKQASDIYYGLTPKQLRKFAFQYASANHLRVPDSWTNNKMASPDWYTSDIKRNKTLP